MIFLIVLLKINLNIIYFFLKLFPTNRKQVVLISRQSDNVTLDFSLLKEEILKIDPEYKIICLCDKVKKSFKGFIKYYFDTLKHLYYLSTSRVCVVDSYCLAVSILKHKKNLTIIQIWHAIATVKKFGYQTLQKEYGRNEKIAKKLNMHKNYDWIISGSNVMAPIFAKAFNTDVRKIKNIGTPRIDYLLKKENVVKKHITKKHPDLIKKKVILYAPTFRKNKKINLDNLINTIDFKKYNLVVKTHPVKNQQFVNKKVFNCPEFSTLELLTVADYVITDYSAISVEASLLNKPVYFYVYDFIEYNKKNGLNIDLYKEMNGLCYRNFKSLYKKLDTENYNYRLLNDFKNKYVDNQNGNSGYLLANYIVNGEWSKFNSNQYVKHKKYDIIKM